MAVLRDAVRLEDTVCHYGGEEFVVLLPNVSLCDAVTAMERVRVARLSYDWGLLGLSETVTVSAGVASSREAAGALSLVAFAERGAVPRQAVGPQPRRAAQSVAGMKLNCSARLE